MGEPAPAKTFCIFTDCGYLCTVFQFREPRENRGQYPLL
jgi:hypothetical protein